MALGGADGGHDALAHARQDRFLAGAADQLLDIGAYGDARLGDQLDAVLRHGRDGRGVDDLGVNRHLHGLEHVAAGQVDGRGHLEVQGDVGLVGGDERHHDLRHVAAGEVVGFQLVGLERESGFRAGDEGHHDGAGIHAPPAHQHELDEGYVHPGQEGLEPQGHGEEPEDDDESDDRDDDPDDGVHVYSFVTGLTRGLFSSMATTSSGVPAATIWLS